MLNPETVTLVMRFAWIALIVALVFYIGFAIWCILRGHEVLPGWLYVPTVIVLSFGIAYLSHQLAKIVRLAPKVW